MSKQKAEFLRFVCRAQTPPAAELRSCQIGPFTVRLVDDDESAFTAVYQPPQLTRKWKWQRHPPLPEGRPNPALPNGIVEQSITHTDEVLGSWTVTAEVSSAEASIDKSVLSMCPREDSGISDLCELLTFITGRRVSSLEFMHRFDPNRSGEAACRQCEALLAASIAWPNRHVIAANGLVYALLSHNLATEFRFLQPKAAQYNTALNVQVDKWPLPAQPKIPLEVRKSLASLVEQAIANCEGIS